MAYHARQVQYYGWNTTRDRTTPVASWYAATAILKRLKVTNTESAPSIAYMNAHAHMQQSRKPSLERGTGTTLLERRDWNVVTGTTLLERRDWNVHTGTIPLERIHWNVTRPPGPP